MSPHPNQSHTNPTDNNPAGSSEPLIHRLTRIFCSFCLVAEAISNPPLVSAWSSRTVVTLSRFYARRA